MRRVYAGRLWTSGISRGEEIQDGGEFLFFLGLWLADHPNLLQRVKRLKVDGSSGCPDLGPAR